MCVREIKDRYGRIEREFKPEERAEESRAM